MHLLFYKGTKEENPKATIWDRIICFVTSSRFSHVEISFENIQGAYRCMSSSFRDHGVREKWIDTSSGRWVIVDISSKYENQAGIEGWIRGNIGKAYDFFGLLGTVITIPVFSSATKWFCSEIIAEALELNNSWSYSPEDLYKLFNK